MEKRLIGIMARVLVFAAVGVFAVATAAAGGRSQSAATAAPTVASGTGPSWTWDTSPVTVGLYLHEGWYTKVWNPDENVRDRAIFDATGVNFDITYPAGDADARLSAMIAANALPDLVVMGYWLEHFRVMASDGRLHDLLELVDQYAPDFRERIPDSMIGWYGEPDGAWYGMPNFFYAPEHMDKYGVGLRANVGMYARKDIMEQLGITAEDFTTQDRMVETLKRVRDAGIVYDGFPVKPFQMSHGGGVNEHSWALGGFFAIPLEDRDGNLLDPIQQQKYLEMMQFLNRLWREGLIFPENMTDQRQQANERQSVGEIFAFIGDASVYQDAMRNLYQIDSNATYVPVGPLRAQDGAPPTLRASSSAGWHLMAVPTSTTIPDRVIRVMNYLYSEEGQRVTSFGVEGVTYDMVNDRVQWRPEYINLLESDPDRHNRIWGEGGGLWWLQNQVYYYSVYPGPATGPERMFDNIQQFFSPYVYYEMAFTNTRPPGGTDESAMDAEIRNYWAGQIPKMIMATVADDVERIWRESLDHIDRLGAARVQTVSNQRFQENKRKLGQEFAWPGNRP